MELIFIENTGLRYYYDGENVQIHYIRYPNQVKKIDPLEFIDNFIDRYSDNIFFEQELNNIMSFKKRVTRDKSMNNILEYEDNLY